MTAFVRLLPDADAVLVFAAGGLSVMEKGAMCMAARAAGRGVVVRFSSGDVPDLCRQHPAFDAWFRVVLRSAHVVVSQGPWWTRFFGAYPEAAGKLIEIRNSVTLGPVSAPVLGRSRVIFVGSMEREKGIFELLEAADIVRRNVPQVRFDLVGGGRDLEAIRAAISRRGLERWVSARGWLAHAETRTEYAASDVFVLPSYFEGLPNALLEAMSSALPAVVTPVGVIPDVIRDGDNGVLVPVREPAPLAAALERLLTDPVRARAIGARARATVADGYDDETAWRKYAAALARACHEAGRHAEIEDAWVAEPAGHGGVPSEGLPNPAVPGAGPTRRGAPDSPKTPARSGG